MPRAYCHPANGYRSWVQLSTRCRASHLDSASRGFLQGRNHPSAQSFPEDAGAYGSGFAGSLAGSASYATHPFLVETEGSSSGLASQTPPRNCVSALTCWRNPLWLKRGVTLDTAHRRKVVTTDASNKGWGALCPAFDLWSEEESTLHINCLEMLAVCQACQIFLPVIRGHHVLICSDSRSVVSYINHQGSLISKRLCMQANDLLVWAQNNLCSLKATHVPAKMNLGADMLWRNNVSLDVLPAHGSENL